MTNARHFQLRFAPPSSLPPSLTTSLIPGPPFAYALPSARTPPFYTDRWGHKGVSAPHHFRPLPFTRPLRTGRPTYWPPPLRPPSRRAHPVPAPSPFRAYGDAKGVVRTLLPLVRGPPPRPCPAPPRPPRPPLCAHAGGAGGTVLHPPSFPFAGSSPLCPGCTPLQLPALHLLCAHAGGRADRASPLPFRSRAGSSPRAAPPPGLCATRRARALPLCTHAGEAQGTVPPPPPSPGGPPPPAAPRPPPIGCP